MSHGPTLAVAAGGSGHDDDGSRRPRSHRLGPSVSPFHTALARDDDHARRADAIRVVIVLAMIFAMFGTATVVAVAGIALYASYR